MASIVQCLLRNCLEYGEDDDGERPSGPPRIRSMIRSSSSSLRAGGGGALGGYFAPDVLADPHEAGGGERGGPSSPPEPSSPPDCCEIEAAAAGSGGSIRTAPSEDEPGSPPSHPTTERVGGGVRELFRRLGFGGGRHGPYGSLGQGWGAGGEGGISPAPSGPLDGDAEDEEAPSLHHPAADRSAHHPHRRSFSNPNRRSLRLYASPKSPLRTASSFNVGGSEHDIIPAISLDEVVMPGSELQKKMSVAMAEALEDQGDECVICLEGFDPTNPRMPTLCGCGENRTYFHLPCLYQWIEQDRNCPSCRKRLRWEEF